MAANAQLGPAKQLVETVRQRFGSKAAITEASDIGPWLTDWRGKFHGRSEAILQPGSTDDVAAILALASGLGVPLVPQGGNTSMVGGATPPADGSALILSLRRMNRIRSVGEGKTVAEAGVILAALHEAASVTSQRFPLTLGARGSCTIGGLVATNAGGTQVLRFGPMRSLVLGLEAVLPDGSVHDGLSGLKKDNRGYSIDHLLIGSEGTLGVITAAALQLVPAAQARAVAWVGVADPQAALELLRDMQAQGLGVEGFEIVPGDSLASVLKHIPGTRSPLDGRHRWHALIETTGRDPGPPLQDCLSEALEQDRIADAVLASSEAQASDFWRIRDSISEAEKKEGPSTAHDISVPVERMPRFMVEAAREVEQAFPGTVASGFGHLGDGNVHFHVRAGRRATDHWHAEDVEEISRFVHDLVTAAGGSISAEHGIGQMKREEFGRLASPARLQALAAIKRAIDPKGLMNPGKLIPPEDQSQRT